MTVGALLLLPPLVTAAAGMLRPTEQGCRILWAVDGDTVWAWCPTDGLMSTRLTGFDTPEFNGHCGSERLRAMAATYVLRWQIWTAGEIGMRALGRDRYGRRLAAVTVDGDALADRMIASGLARPYDGGRRASWCDR